MSYSWCPHREHSSIIIYISDTKCTCAKKNHDHDHHDHNRWPRPQWPPPPPRWPPWPPQPRPRRRPRRRRRRWWRTTPWRWRRTTTPWRRRWCRDADDAVCARVFRSEERDARQQVERTRRDLTNLEASRANKLRQFGEWMPELLRQIDMGVRDGRFHKRPRGPLGQSPPLPPTSGMVGLKPPVWAASPRPQGSYGVWKPRMRLSFILFRIWGLESAWIS